ncbi:ARMT1-like domain-containing protein [Petroclostridium sp. X23]|uniref:damage-control phosphatase ARMT1 family protein n=1 Tax=Petroclostridium sp. X23 TaxID=3045146 RepID=UPI0024AD20A3|nr:ARMT1-like domain-containing protein [Petroclostridium sp. X23]WHH59508.1 ARMT1-like domain-containing protein [Petroclostridium sp. X23]
MEVYLDCLPCFLRQVLETTRMITNELDVQDKIMQDTIGLVLQYKRYKYSPELGRDMHNIIKKYTDIADPYKTIKEKSIELAEDLYPSLKHFLYRKYDNRLYWALKVSAMGNIIDYAINHHIDIKACIENELEKEFAINDIERFEKQFRNAKTLLIIGDNAGETVFDKVLIEDLLQLKITYAVRSEPIINDATYEDAYASGLSEHCNIISTGCNAPGLILEESSKEFSDIFRHADIVISKGQGNFETLSDVDREVFFLLKVKCPVVANLVNVDVNEYIFKHSGKIN